MVPFDIASKGQERRFLGRRKTERGGGVTAEGAIAGGGGAPVRQLCYPLVSRQELKSWLNYLVIYGMVLVHLGQMWIHKHSKNWGFDICKLLHWEVGMPPQ